MKRSGPSPSLSRQDARLSRTLPRTDHASNTVAVTLPGSAEGSTCEDLHKKTSDIAGAISTSPRRFAEGTWPRVSCIISPSATAEHRCLVHQIYLWQSRVRMSFNIETKTRMFVASGRLCCLCLKQCGVNIEAAHIIDKHDGGMNEYENGIPVCFDCHTEMGHYSSDHPKGNKFRPEELIARRDRVYDLVGSGVIYAQIIASQIRTNTPSTAAFSVPNRPEPSQEAKEVAAIFDQGNIRSPGTKLRLLAKQDRALILDQLIEKSAKSVTAVEIIGKLTSEENVLSADEHLLLLEKTLRRVTLVGEDETKAALFRELAPGVLASADAGLRSALFADAIETVKADQYDEVNLLVPPLVNHAEFVPAELQASFGLAILDQTRSSSWKGAPAARRSLRTLPAAVAEATLRSLTKDQFRWHVSDDDFRAFIAANIQFATNELRPFLEDYLKLSGVDFLQKHYSLDF